MILLLNSPPKFTETKFLDTVVYKGTPICQKSLRKVFQNSKERLMVDDVQRLPTQFERQIAITNK